MIELNEIPNHIASQLLKIKAVALRPQAAIYMDIRHQITNIL